MGYCAFRIVDAHDHPGFVGSPTCFTLESQDTTAGMYTGFLRKGFH